MNTENEDNSSDDMPEPNLRGVLESSFDTVEAAQPVDNQPLSTDVAPVSTAPQSSDSPAVSEKSTAEVSQETPPTKESTPPVDQTEQQKLARPPQSWRGDAKQVWNDIPLAAKQEIQRRELDQQAALRENASIRSTMQTVNEVVNPHMDWIQAEKENPTQLMGRMFNMERVARFGTAEQKADLAAEYLLAYGVDLQQLDNILSKRLNSPAQQQQPNIEQLVQQRIERELQPLREQQRQQQQEIDQGIQSELTAFADSHPYFEDVRMEMSDLIELASRRGQVLSLEDAYKRATTFHPSVHSKLGEIDKLKTATSSISGVTRGTVHATDPNDMRALIANQLGGE
jgi:hypothetical protein